MSTSPAHPGASPRSGSAFRRALVAMFAVLAVLCTGLAVLTLGQGPKLSRADIDENGVVVQTNQRLLLYANEQLASVSPDQIRISPSVPVTASTEGNVLALTFGARLRYATDYVVTVSGVTSPFQDRASDLSYSFTTGSPSVYYLHRSGQASDAPGKADDEIIRTGVTGSESTVVYRAPRIQDFAEVGTSLAVATLADDGTTELSVAVPGATGAESLPLPARGTITQLDSSVKQAMLGFRFTSSDPAAGFDNTLIMFDLLKKHAYFTLPGTIGHPLTVDGWRFIPDSTLVMTTTEEKLYVYDVAAQQGVLIGDYDEVGQVAPSGEQAVIGRDGVGSVLDLVNGGESALPGSLPAGDVGLSLPVLGADGASWSQAVSATVDGQARQAVLRVDAQGARALYTTDGADAQIVDVTMSPNDQYLTVALAPHGTSGPTDGYANDPNPLALTTVIVDRASGSIIRTLQGSRIAWP